MSADAIFRAALRLVDREGLEALTMRRLAADLGVAPMSLYTHVPNKDDLLHGLVNFANAEMQLPRPETPPWDALRVIVREFRRVTLLHPNLVPLVTNSPPRPPEGLRTLEAALDALRRAGIPAPLVAKSYRLMASFSIGFVLLECGGFFRPLESAQGAPELGPTWLDDRPRIVEVGPYLAEWDADEEFEAGMDAVISVLVRYTSAPD